MYVTCTLAGDSLSSEHTNHTVNKYIPLPKERVNTT